MTINEYLLKYPKQVEILYTKIFGNYLLRYYNINDYSVLFSAYSETSYQDEQNKQIVISLNNVIHMLEKGVNVLAVAYHEMAHTLYTSNKTRDDIQKKALKFLLAEHDAKAGQVIHSLWNILEDYMIERELMFDYPFLEPIIAPLKTIIEDDNALLTWRKGEPLLGNRQDIVDLATQYTTTKKISNKVRAEILAYIYKKYYQQDESMQDKVSGSEKIREKLGAIQNIKDYQERIDDNNKQLETSTEDWVRESFVSANERNERIINLIKQEYQDKYGEELELEQVADDGLSDLERISRIETNDEQEQLFKNVLYKEQKIIEEKQELKTYNDSVDEVLEIKKVNVNLQYYKILDIYSAKQRVRNGMSQALSKKYSFDITPKLSVSRLVSSKANKTIPNIFQNKGKDINFLKKIVIFEDVSGSTLGSGVNKIFSQIAKGLANSFESVEWWGYSDKLWLKPKSFYDYQTAQVGNHLGVSSGSGTSAYKLLNVMKKYKKQDNTYIIITDGDMHNVFKHKELWNYFKDRTCVIGLLDDTIKNNSPHYVELEDAVLNIRKEQKEKSDDYQKAMIKAGSFAIKQAIQMVEGRIK